MDEKEPESPLGKLMLLESQCQYSPDSAGEENLSATFIHNYVRPALVNIPSKISHISR